MNYVALDMDTIFAIMTEEKGNQKETLKINTSKLKKYFPKNTTALAFDTQRQLRFELGGTKAVMPFAQCADGAENGSVRDIAVLTRVGRPTCFIIESLDTDESGQPFYRLSRAEAQRMCICVGRYGCNQKGYGRKNKAASIVWHQCELRKIGRAHV